MIQGFCFGVIFVLTLADLVYKINHYDQVDTNNAVCVIFFFARRNSFAMVNEAAKNILRFKSV